MKFSYAIKLAGTFSALTLAGCATSNVVSNNPLCLPQNASMLVIPFVNNSDTPAAGDRAANMVAGLLEVGGVSKVTLYHFKKSCDPLKNCEGNQPSQRRLMRWAARHGYHYIVNGTVNEWRYKVGLDGEPSVGATVTIKDVQTGVPLWTAVGSRTGHSWSGLSHTAQTMFQIMFSNFTVR